MTNQRWFTRGTALLFLAVLISSLAAGQRRPPAAEQGGADPGPLSQLRFRTIGVIGNRASAIVGEPGKPNVVYIGAASGGIFKTDDGINIRNCSSNWHPAKSNTKSS